VVEDRNSISILFLLQQSERLGIVKQKIEKYLELTKPKVTLLNLLVGATCFTLGAFPSFNPLKLAVFAFAGYLACGGCGALNCVYDQNVDKLMHRTSRRAIPQGDISVRNALIFGSVITAAGIGLSYIFFNLLTAVMMILGTAFYIVVYTVWLKRTSSWNVVIGGAAGCFAAFSGWTAAANSLSLLPLLISSIDFLWTPGHLWALAMKKVGEYKKAGIPMLPVTIGLKKTAQIIFIFNIVAVVSSLLLSVFGLAGIFYSLVAVSAGAWFVLENKKLLMFPSGAGGFRVFLVSMPYLSILMIGLVIDKLL
jgi:protoheme IX farnesyltransferase